MPNFPHETLLMLGFSVLWIPTVALPHFLRENAAFLFKLECQTSLYYNSAQSLLNGPPLSNFVDRGLGEWEWLGPGSTKINKDYLYYNNSAHGPPKWPLSVVTQHSDVFITETRFTQHGPVLISGCSFTQHGRVLISRSFLI
jgi:hypothetical protein